MIRIEAEIDPAWGEAAPWRALATKAVMAAAEAAGRADLLHPASPAEVSIAFTGDSELQALNARWRGKDKPTNVLSFPMLPAGRLVAPGSAPVMIGDIAIARGLCAAEAIAQELPFTDHAAHLIVHGMLHLVGHDHEQGDERAEQMEAIERAALATMGIADPYAQAERAHA